MKKFCLLLTILLLSVFSTIWVISMIWWLEGTISSYRIQVKTLINGVMQDKQIHLDIVSDTTSSSTIKTTHFQTQKIESIPDFTSASQVLKSTESQQTAISAYKRDGFANVNLMQKMKELRPLFTYILTPWKINCTKEKSSTVSLVIGVKSHPDNSERRVAIRETWGSYNSFKGFKMQVFFVVGRTKESNQSKLVSENMAHGDILQIDMKEVYTDVGKKAIAAMQWVEENCPITWFYASSDDDMLVNVFSIYQRIKKSSPTRNITDNKTENLPILCGFSLRDNRKPLGPQRKNAVPKSVYNFDAYPTFCAGGFYTMPVMLSNAIFQMSRQHKYFYNDDVWITGLLRLAVVDAGEYPCGNITDKYCAITKTDYRDALHIMKPENRLPGWKRMKKRMDLKIKQLQSE